MTNRNNTKNKSKRGIVLRLGTYVLREWKLFIPAIIFTLLSNQLALLGPKYSGAAIDAIEALGGVNFELVWKNIIIMVVCYAVSALLSYFLALIMIHLSQRIIYLIRNFHFCQYLQ